MKILCIGVSMSEIKLIKSPMNYVGGKYKLLPQIIPLFPKEIDTFIDLFCGGFNVGINVKANRIIGNDVCNEVIEVYKGIQKEGLENSLKLIKNEINKYELSKTNEKGYKSIRDKYNSGDNGWYVFYSMLVHSFNYQIRFNKKGEYNMAEEPKIFTKSQLVEKLTEVAKKQKEKNDLILQEKDEEITRLNDELTNLTESLNQFKNTQEQILNNVNALTDMNKQLSEENAKLKDQIFELEVKQNEITNTVDTTLYQEFFDTVKNLVLKYNNENDETSLTGEIPAQKKQRKSRQKKNSEDVVITEKSADVIEENEIKEEQEITELPAEQLTEDQIADVEVNSSDEDSIDVDALLSEL
jgi:site-specific DNA-adenine methylase